MISKTKNKQDIKADLIKKLNEIISRNQLIPQQLAVLYDIRFFEYGTGGHGVEVKMVLKHQKRIFHDTKISLVIYIKKQRISFELSSQGGSVGPKTPYMIPKFMILGKLAEMIKNGQLEKKLGRSLGGVKAGT